MSRIQFTILFAAVVLSVMLILLFVGPGNEIERPKNGSIVPASLVADLKHRASRKTVEKRLGRPIRVADDCIYYRGPGDNRTKQGPARVRGKAKWINYRWQLCFDGSRQRSQLIDRQLYASNF